MTTTRPAVVDVAISPAIVALFDPGWRAFRYCGFGPVRRHYLARLKHTTPARRAAWLVEVERRARAIASRL